MSEKLRSAFRFEPPRDNSGIVGNPETVRLLQNNRSILNECKRLFSSATIWKRLAKLFEIALKSIIATPTVIDKLQIHGISLRYPETRTKGF